MEELIEGFHVGVNDLVVLGHRLVFGEEPAKHGAQMIGGERDTRGGRGFAHAGAQIPRATEQIIVKAGLTDNRHGGQACGHRNRIAG